MTEVTIRKAEWRDAEQVLRLISSRTMAEFNVADISPVDTVRAAFDRQDPVFVSAQGDRFLTLFGFTDFGRYASMWTIATEAFFDMGVGGVVKTRKFFRGLDLGKPLWVITAAPHQDTDRWLELLGFRKMGHDGIRREFVYPR